MSWSIPDWLDKQTLNSIALFLIVLWLSSERKKLKEQLAYHLDALRQQVLAVREDVEAQESSSAQNTAQLQNWENIRSKWADARERLEIMIEQLDGRVRRKYGKISRYNYEDIIRQLQNDKSLTTGAANALSDMNRRFFSLRSNPARATLQDVISFAELHRRAGTELPSTSG